MSEQQVIDPLGIYEAWQDLRTPDTTLTGLKIALLLPACGLAMALGVWGIVSAARGLLG